MSKHNQPNFIYQSSHLLTPEQIVALKEKRKKRFTNMNQSNDPNTIEMKVIENQMMADEYFNNSLGLTLPPQQQQEQHHQHYVPNSTTYTSNWQHTRPNILEETLENQKYSQDRIDYTTLQQNINFDSLKSNMKSPNQLKNLHFNKKDKRKSIQTFDEQNLPSIDTKSQKSILLSPAWMAVNACISGKSINDIEFYVEEENESAFANRAMLEKICPQLIKKISSKGILIFDAETVPQKKLKSDNFPKIAQPSLPDAFLQQAHQAASPQQLLRKSEGILHDQPSHSGPLNWLKVANSIRMMPKKQHSDPVMEDIPIRIPTPPPKKPISSSSMNRVYVAGCSVQTMRALLFYLITNEYKFFVLNKNDKSQNDLLSIVNGPPLFNAQSAYSLASDLNITNLQTISQSYIFSHLEIQSALLQYFTPFCQRFPTIRRGILKFIETNWHEIRQRPETQQALIRLANGDFPQGHMALFKLFCRMEVSPNPPAPSSC